MKHYNLLIPGFNKPKEWVEIWSKYYSYGDEEKYYSNIHKVLDSQEAFFSLFKWKNGFGDKIADKKKISIMKFYQKIDILRSFKSKFQWDVFENEFLPDKNATIWKIFLLHLTNPNEFPIFDQHVHRAFIFIKEGWINDEHVNNSRLYRIYKNEYKPWFDIIKTKYNINPKLMDEALFSFGKFLKEIEKYPIEILVRN